jgi:DNA (cytosine-5)-methyltransferase 1
LVKNKEKKLLENAKNLEKDPPIPFSVVSLFAGAGGLDVGVEQAGLKVIWANEWDRYACETYKANHPHVEVVRGDIKKVEEFPKADLVVGGYPCQGFSLAGKRLITDDRNSLYKEFVRCLQLVKPKFFIAENVKGMLTLGEGEIIKAMAIAFEEQGYKVQYQLVNAKNFGVPQDRERVFIVGVRNDINYKYSFPKNTHGDGSELKPYVSMKDAIGGLNEEQIGGFDESGYSSRYLSRNRKRNWNEVSFTIQASGRQAPLHPSGEPMIKIEKDHWILPKTSIHRKLSASECALIQTFPPDYIWKGDLSSKYKQVGNAVPCLLGEVIVKPIADYLKTYYGI